MSRTSPPLRQYCSHLLYTCFPLRSSPKGYSCRYLLPHFAKRIHISTARGMASLPAYTPFSSTSPIEINSISTVGSTSPSTVSRISSTSSFSTSSSRTSLSRRPTPSVLSFVDTGALEAKMMAAKLDTFKGYSSRNYGTLHQQDETEYLQRSNMRGINVLREPALNKGESDFEIASLVYVTHQYRHIL